MPQSKSSKRWLKEHHADVFVKQAKQQGYRARAAYKLLALQTKDKLIRPGDIIIDLGAAPGSWSQVAGELLKNQGKILALDILPMAPIAGVDFIQGDFREPDVLEQILQQVQNKTVDLILSDMAPNLTGIASVDQPRMLELAELALDLAQRVLRPGGKLVMKVFQGAGFEGLLKQVRIAFSEVHLRKPEASRARSAEIYLVAKGYRQQT